MVRSEHIVFSDYQENPVMTIGELEGLGYGFPSSKRILNTRKLGDSDIDMYPHTKKAFEAIAASGVFESNSIPQEVEALFKNGQLGLREVSVSKVDKYLNAPFSEYSIEELLNDSEGIYGIQIVGLDPEGESDDVKEVLDKYNLRNRLILAQRAEAKDKYVYDVLVHRLSEELLSGKYSSYEEFIDQVRESKLPFYGTYFRLRVELLSASLWARFGSDYEFLEPLVNLSIEMSIFYANSERFFLQYL